MIPEPAQIRSEVAVVSDRVDRADLNLEAIRQRMGTLAANLTASETILAGQIAELGQRISEVAAAKGWGDAAGPPENFFEAIQTQVEKRLDAYGKRIEATLE